MRRVVTYLVAIAVAAGTIVATATAAHANEGGCNTYSVQGFSIGVCVNDDGTNWSAYPDIYVNSTPLGVLTNCTINISVWDSYNNRYSAFETSSCAKNHYNGNPGSPLDRQPRGLHAFARLDWNGHQYAVGDSPGIAVFVIGGVTCYAASCLGRDPVSTHCQNDAHDVLTVQAPGDGGSNEVTMRRSDDCNAKWAKWSGTDPGYGNFWIIPGKDGYAHGRYQGDSNLDYSAMVDGSKPATVCVVSYVGGQSHCNWN